VRIHDLAFYFAAFFIIGIATASLKINVWLILVLSPLFGVVIFYLKKNRFMSFLPLIIIGGFFYYHFFLVLNKDIITYDKEISFQGLIERQPKYGLNSQTLNISLRDPYKADVQVYLSPYPEFHYGDLIEFSGKIQNSSYGKNILSFPKIRLISENNGDKIVSSLFSFKNKLIDNLKNILSVDKSALISGILFGERSEFTKEFKDALSKSGTTHIVALSGYNISIIGVILCTFLGYFLNRRKSFYISIAFIVAFVLMTGAEASVVRAGIMGIIAMLAENQSRLYSFRNAITLTAFVMVLLDPRIFISDIGFQLSFVALLGIVYLQPLLIKGISRFYKNISNPGVLGWRKNLTQTFSAQIAVAPIILNAFGYLSPLSLISNVLILEFMPITMILGFLASFLGIISYHLSLLVGWFLGIFLGYEILIINLFGSY